MAMTNVWHAHEHHSTYTVHTKNRNICGSFPFPNLCPVVYINQFIKLTILIPWNFVINVGLGLEPKWLETRTGTEPKQLKTQVYRDSQSDSNKWLKTDAWSNGLQLKIKIKCSRPKATSKCLRLKPIQLTHIQIYKLTKTLMLETKTKKELQVWHQNVHDQVQNLLYK